MSVSAGIMSKEKDKNSTKYKVLIAGVVIGVLMLVVGAYFFVEGGSASVAPNNGKNGYTTPSENIGSTTVTNTSDPLKIIANKTHATALVAAANAENAQGRVNAAEEAFKTVKKLGGLIGGLGR